MIKTTEQHALRRNWNPQRHFQENKKIWLHTLQIQRCHASEPQLWHYWGFESPSKQRMGTFYFIHAKTTRETKITITQNLNWSSRECQKTKVAHFFCLIIIECVQDPIHSSYYCSGPQVKYWWIYHNVRTFLSDLQIIKNWICLQFILYCHLFYPSSWNPMPGPPCHCCWMLSRISP